MRYISKKYREENEEIKCKCGCGETFLKYDKEGRERKYISGHNGRKYKDPTQHKREWNHRNRKSRFKYKTEFGHKRKVKLVQQFEGKCKYCIYSYDGMNASAFDFHHIVPALKSFSLSMVAMVNRKWSEIEEEVKKCELICSNCHRELHSGGW